MLKVGDKVIVKTHDYRTNKRKGVIKSIEHLLEKSEKPPLTKYYVEFTDKSSIMPIRRGDFVRKELKKVI